jgi:hypothetical protein
MITNLKVRTGHFESKRARLDFGDLIVADLPHF